MPVYHVIEGHGAFEFHQDAVSYLADLQKRYAGQDDYDHLEIKEYPKGRPEGHKTLLWAAEGVWDLVDKKVLTYQRAWLWDGELTKWPQVLKGISPGTTRNRYVAVFLAETEEVKFVKRCKRHLSGVKCEPVDAANCRIEEVVLAPLPDSEG